MRYFNGTTDRIDYTAGQSINMTARPCTISSWVLPNSVSGGGTADIFFAKTVDATGQLGVALAFRASTAGQVQFLRARSAGADNYRCATGVNSVHVGTLTHIAAVNNGGIVAGSTAIYVNGRQLPLTEEALGSGAEDTIDGNFCLGGVAINDTLNYNGYLGPQCFWDRALSAADIAALALGEDPRERLLEGMRFHTELIGSSYQNDFGGSAALDGTLPYSTRFRYKKPTARIYYLGGDIAPTISSTNNTNKLIDESSFVITGTNLTSATAVTFKQATRPDYVATAFITANDATSVTLTGLDVQDMSMAYGAATVSVTTAGGTSADFAITIQQQATHQYITLSGHTPGDGWALGEATANSDQLVAPVTTTLGGTFAFVGTDGSYTITYGGTAPTNDSAYWAWFDDSADQWYESTIAINAAAGGGAGVARSLTSPLVRSLLRAI